MLVATKNQAAWPQLAHTRLHALSHHTPDRYDLATSAARGTQRVQRALGMRYIKDGSGIVVVWAGF